MLLTAPTGCRLTDPWLQIDYHPHDQEEMYLNDPETFAKKWRYLWAAFNCLPGFDSNLKGRVFLDLLNEPDEYGWVQLHGCVASAGMYV